MDAAHTTKFALGIAVAVAGVGLLIYSRGRRGQKRQTGVMMLIGGAVLIAAGLGLFESPL